MALADWTHQKRCKKVSHLKTNRAGASLRFLVNAKPLGLWATCIRTICSKVDEASYTPDVGMPKGSYFFRLPATRKPLPLQLEG